MKKKFVVIAYDIENNKKRRVVSDLLAAHGKRVNKSVFECYISARNLGVLKEELQHKVKASDDVILYYPLCPSCLDKRERQGYVAAEEMVKVF